MVNKQTNKTTYCVRVGLFLFLFALMCRHLEHTQGLSFPLQRLLEMAQDLQGRSSIKCISAEINTDDRTHIDVDCVLQTY